MSFAALLGYIVGGLLFVPVACVLLFGRFVCWVMDWLEGLKKQ